jgi:large subunit ribosomal protein L9
MKIIFIKDVKGHGKKGETREVKDGFAQNYLIKNGYAVKATDTSIKRLNNETEEEKINHDKEVLKANLIKKELEKETLVFEVKTGDKDKVFGSISTKQIALILKEKKYDIEKNKIHLEEPLSTIGFHNVKIELHKEVNVDIKVQIIKERR